jgi:prevent-host-death family protein
MLGASVTYSVHEAKTQFSKLLDLIEKGEEVAIVRRGEPVAQLVAPPPVKKKPIFDSMRGEISWTEGWERPFTAKETDDFFDGKW